MTRRIVRSLAAIAAVLCMLPLHARAADVAIVASSEILPYTTCIDGIKEALSDASLKTTVLPVDTDDARAKVRDIQGDDPRLMIAIGPQAAFAMAAENGSVPRLFCMILNPDKVIGNATNFPGISLNIPPALQMQTIRQALAGRTRIGVFYTPRSNQAAIDAFAAEAKKNNLVLVPFAVSSAGRISAELESKNFAVDALLIIPDEQFSSTKIVAYVIKECLRKKIPVIGYNSWFAKNGAVLAFVIDYEGVGRQAAGLARRLLAEGAAAVSGVMPPAAVSITIDAKTAAKLGVQLAPAALKRADEVIR